MFVQERRQLIMEQLYEKQSIHVSDLISQFNVSFETIRRDLEYLEKHGLLKRVHGGAILTDTDYKRELKATAREYKYNDAKKELSKTALQLINEGDSIAIDVSTTNNMFAQAIKNSVKRLTVLTNSFPIAMELMDMPHYTVIFIGGVIRGDEQCTEGTFAERFAEQFHVDKYFMSVSGVSLTEGITDYDVGEVQLKKRLMSCAKETIILADRSKIGQVSLLPICGLNDISKVVTDSKINDQEAKKFAEHGCSIIYSTFKDGDV